MSKSNSKRLSLKVSQRWGAWGAVSIPEPDELCVKAVNLAVWNKLIVAFSLPVFLQVETIINRGVKSLLHDANKKS